MPKGDSTQLHAFVLLAKKRGKRTDAAHRRTQTPALSLGLWKAIPTKISPTAQEGMIRLKKRVFDPPPPHTNEKKSPASHAKRGTQGEKHIFWPLILCKRLLKRSASAGGASGSKLYIFGLFSVKNCQKYMF